MDEQSVMDKNWGKMVHFIVTEETASERDMWEMGGVFPNFFAWKARRGPTKVEWVHGHLKIPRWFSPVKWFCGCSWPKLTYELRYANVAGGKRGVTNNLTGSLKLVTSIPFLGLAPTNPLRPFFLVFFFFFIYVQANQQIIVWNQKKQINK